MLDTLRKQPEYQECLDAIKLGRQPATLGLIRSARLPVLAALCTDLSVPILLLTDRSDRAALMFDELSFWLPDTTRVYFPEPTPMFYENAAWGSLTRRDRLHAFSTLVQYFKPGSKKPDKPLRGGCPVACGDDPNTTALGNSSLPAERCAWAVNRILRCCGGNLCAWDMKTRMWWSSTVNSRGAEASWMCGLRPNLSLRVLSSLAMN